MSDGAIVITGANGGIGQYIARYLLERGERELVCHYRGEREKVDALLREFQLDPRKHAIQGELTSEESVGKMATTLRLAFGGVGRLVNVAGSSTNSMHWKLSKFDFLQVINDSLLSTFLCCKAFVPQMRENRFGRIVNVSSIVGLTGVAGASHYAAAKAGIVGFTKSIALELAPRNITANVVALGYFDVGLITSISVEMQEELRKRIPVGRLGSENDVGAAVNYLLCDDASFLTGQVIHLNGGQA